jgi:7-keto-8-aminopelargonate synthetase-like enzyme
MEDIIDSGFFVGTSLPPVTSRREAGIRITITALHTFEQIEKFCLVMKMILEEHA